MNRMESAGMAKKKAVYTIEREFLKKYEIKQSVEMIITQYIKNGGKGKIPNRTIVDSSIKQ